MRMLALLLALCFCIPAAAEEKTVDYSEPLGASLPFRAERVESEFAVFLFDTMVDMQTREACMAAVDELLGRLPPMEKPELCLTTKKLFVGAVVEGHRLYLNPMDWQSVDFAALVLQAAAGEYSHYGLAYGLAGWCKGENGGFAQMQEATAYDLNLLCFDPAFVPEADAANARTQSVDFAGEYISVHGVSACLSLLLESDTADGMLAVAEALQRYYAAHGVETDVSSLRFAQGGKAYLYRAKVEGAEFYVGRGWQDANYAHNPLVTEKFLREDYAAVRRFFCTNERQMAQYRQLFAVAGPWKDVTVLLPNPQRQISTSCYQPTLHRILLLNVDSLMHEYIHALMPLRLSQALWESEGFARYFSYYYDEYGMAFLNEDYNNLPDLAHLQYLRDYQASIGRPVDMAIDFGDLESFRAYALGYRAPDVDYASGSAFVHYLVKRFGEEAVVRHVCGMEMLPQDASELTADWLAWVDENYQGFTETTTEP